MERSKGKARRGVERDKRKGVRGEGVKRSRSKDGRRGAAGVGTE